MDWIDIKNKFPTEQGIYWVKIRTNAGGEKICKADWVRNRFSPKEETIRGNEFIFEWSELD